MDEQLEVAFEGAGMEGQSEAPVSPGSEAGAAEEKAEEAVRQEQVNGSATRGEASENARKATASDALTAPSELRDSGAESVIDLGCGECRLTSMLLSEPQIFKIH